MSPTPGKQTRSRSKGKGKKDWTNMSWEMKKYERKDSKTIKSDGRVEKRCEGGDGKNEGENGREKKNEGRRKKSKGRREKKGKERKRRVWRRE